MNYTRSKYFPFENGGLRVLMDMKLHASAMRLMLAEVYFYDEIGRIFSRAFEKEVAYLPVGCLHEAATEVGLPQASYNYAA